ncbi:SET domain-containing protein 5 [Podospora aff. communis PSN243]|uniref:SET domain-containing protein 5 n=1 Tax=Podospora aff. communis PSN243 TaxID=3040156 RepID=A0AAV9G9J8_9PEZI|nr:SET domain-containing protein 5 [Podospora aff. communis PSN243]
MGSHNRDPDESRGVRLGSSTRLLLALLVRALPARAAQPQCSAAVPPVLRHPILDPSAACSPLIDDTVQPRPANYSPWTHAPICEVSSADDKKKYCVYTNSRHGPHGISLLTTPEIAADGVGILDEFLTLESNENGPFKVVDIPGKGKGVVATRLIKRYEPIMVDYSVLLIDMGFATEVPARKGYRLLHAAADRLANPDSVRTLGQSNGLAKDPIENVLRTNGFHTMLGGGQHMALYPLVSRINHACKPNAYNRFGLNSLQKVVIGAARDIQPGEEITISYITLGKPTSERKESLKLWNFACTCDLCTSPASELAASDARRTKIESLRDKAIDAFQAGKPYEALRLTRQVINLLPSEELFPMYAEQFENMARIYFVLRDKENAYKYAKLSLDTLVEQGYLDRVKPEHYERMWRKFYEEEYGRY